MARKLRMGMIGGGAGSFIGDVHRRAAAIDGLIDFPDYPTIHDGVRGMQFIYAAVESDKNNATWQKLN